MFFVKWERNPEIEIDGEIYTISAAANVANYDCRNAMFDLCDFFSAVNLEHNCTHENYLDWKKGVVKAMKDWEKQYVKH